MQYPKATSYLNYLNYILMSDIEYTKLRDMSELFATSGNVLNHKQLYCK